MLDDLTIGIILTCKHGYKNNEYKDAIKEFLSDYTLTPIKYYTESALRFILIHCFEDYIENVKSPRWIINEFFGFKYGIDPMDDTDAIIGCFRGAQVREYSDPVLKKLTYVNGFHDFEFKELKLTLYN